jgi:poly(3-hydroxybutyrate) depolymerase
VIHHPEWRTNVWPITYRAWNGKAAAAAVITPEDVGPQHAPELPLIICPHGRGVRPIDVPAMWQDLPARGRFAVICPESYGRKLTRISWGWHRQIDDLVRMPTVARETLPWLRLAPGRVFCLGGSMGGQETLLLVARNPDWLKGAAAFDSPCDMTLRYYDFPASGKGSTAAARRLNGLAAQALCRFEAGGTPKQVPAAYADRSPLSHAAQLVGSWTPLQVWWSPNDHVVIHGARHSHLLVERMKELDARAAVTEFVGDWEHSHEMHQKIPQALTNFGLL